MSQELLPAIIQHAQTNQVLMLGYMNEESLAKTKAEGKVTFYSRSKQRLWTKGETSGNFLNVVSIEMPPLRNRSEDIVLLANAFLKEFAEDNGRPLKPLTDAALQCLAAHDWPGNVRELRTAIEHGVVMSNDEHIDLGHLPRFLAEPQAQNGSAGKLSNVTKKSLDASDEFNLHELETQAIRSALAAAAGNRTHAAELLGVSRRTLQRKLKILGH